MGYILVTFILVTSISIILLIGYPAFTQELDRSHLQNMEEGFYIMASEGNKVAMLESTFQSAELKLHGGSLGIREDGYINIFCYSDHEGNNLMGNNSTTLSAMEYSINDQGVAYLLGGVCRKNGDYTYAVKNPEIYNSSNMFVVPVIKFYNSNVAISGNGLTRISISTPYYSKLSQYVSYPMPSYYDNVKRIDVHLSGDYTNYLSRFFQDELYFNELSNTGGVVVLSNNYTSGIKFCWMPSYVTITAK
ncbi:hypothetical protein CUJ83_06975 [Methanocella sp. CWC-04]|uniref:Uncharacterized protein n=2 Tax=Methanooceanicella nereidis TaxID=2052831 RepID=A0AAP2RDR3_9EURY|nr:hypothetical protein [Methanocella sp. CWC-04]